MYIQKYCYFIPTVREMLELLKLDHYIHRYCTYSPEND